MHLLTFFSIASKRLRSRILLSFLILLTMALTVALTVCIPVFSGAVSLHIMQGEIDRRSDAKGLPLFSVSINALPSERQPLGIQEIERTRDRLGNLMQQTLKLPLLSLSVEVESPVYRLTPRADDINYDTQYLASVRVIYIQDVDQYIEIVEGRPFGTPNNDPTILSVWIEQSFLNTLAMDVGELYDLGGLYSSASDGIHVEIAGTYRLKDGDQLGALGRRSLGVRYNEDLLTDTRQFSDHISNRIEQGADAVTWHYVFDDLRVNLSRAEQYIAGLQSIEREAQRTLPSGQMGIAPMEELLRGQQRKTSLVLVLFGFSLPILVFLVYFTASLSTMQARYQEQEIATLVSRGCNAGQVLVLSGTETLILIAVAIPFGVLIGLLLAYSLSYAGGFLTFINREPLKISLSSVDWLPIIGIVGVNLWVRLIAAWRTRGLTVVTHSRVVTRNTVRQTITRYLYIALLIAVTAYAYRQLEHRGVLALTSLEALDPRNDPLLLLAPTLFMFSAPLLATELFMLLTVLLGFVGRFLPGTAIYLACLNLARSSRYYRIPIYVLILSLSMGVFYASMAKSADLWLLDSQRYAHGADLTFKVGEAAEGEIGGQASLGPLVPAIPEDEYLNIDDVINASRVGDFTATIHGKPNFPNVRLLAINRLTFPGVAYFRTDYANDSLGELMNRLAESPNGILLPSQLLGPLMLNIGDTLRLNINIYGDVLLPMEFIVVGVFNYFPTMYPDIASVLVTNLDYLEFQTVNQLPHTVWMRLEPGAEVESVMRGVRQLLLMIPADVQDLEDTLKTESVKLDRTGIFGMLSVCFLAGAMLAVANLLVYSTLMLHERSVHHAVLRALGVSLQSVLSTVILESIVSLIYGLGIGVVSGVLCARLYVPFFALGGTSKQPIPPFISQIDWTRTEWIAGVMVVAMLLAEVFVLVRLIRARLFEALRMGSLP